MEDNKKKHQIYWFQDLNILTNVDNLNEMMPTKRMNHAEKVNSLVRLSIIAGIILSLTSRDSNWMIIPVVFMAMTYVMFLFRMDKYEMEIKKLGPNKTHNDLPQEVKDKFECVLNNKACAISTTSNPFMNSLPFDKRSRAPACDVLDTTTQRNMNNKYNQNTYLDASNIFRGGDGLRQFYTAPSTTYPNNRDNFAKWLYSTPATCKEGNGAQCIANVHNPLQRRLFAPGHGST
jgi:hypothetical protein